MKDKSLLECIIRPEILALDAYHVPDARGLVKLDAMENPYAWPADVRHAWAEMLRDVELNRYPDPGADTLKAQLREALAVPAPAAPPKGFLCTRRSFPRAG